MGMDPKQEEQPPVGMSPRKRRRTAAVADVRVNQEAGTPVERLAREMGAEPVPELGRARDRDRDGGRENGEPENDEPDRDFQQRSERALAGEPTPAEEEEVAVKPSEARRTLKARREHSKGDGNFPRVEPGPEMLDERPEDRRPRDLPKARDDRSAPKGNVTVGQDERNPDFETRDKHEAPSPRTLAVAPRRVVAPKATGPAKPARTAASQPKRRAQAAPGAKRTRAGRKPAGKKTNVRKRPAATRTTAKRRPMKSRATRSSARKGTKSARKATRSSRRRASS